MVNPGTKLATGVRSLDPVWARIRDEAEAITRHAPELATFILSTVLNHDKLEEAVADRVASRLDHPDVSASLIRQAYGELFESDPSVGDAMRADIVAVADRDPAATRYIEPVLYFKGFHALQTHRLSHFLWNKGRKDFALYLQSRASSVFAVDINPATRIGRGVFIDHGTGVVIGATAVIEDDVSLLQGVTLGGTGKERGDRHPKLRRGVLIGAGAKVLGNIEIGECSRVASGSVVLKRVPPRTTVAGIPARVVGTAPCDESPAHTMDQVFESPFLGEGI